MSNDEGLTYCIGILLFILLFPQILTLCTARRVQADDSCGINETNTDGECVCNPCYTRDAVTGKCTMCEEHCNESTNADGEIVCKVENAIEELGKKANEEPNLQPIKEKDLFRVANIFDTPGNTLQNASRYRVDEFVPGIYPDFENYNHVEFTSLEDMNYELLQGALNINDLQPHLTSLKASNPGHISRGYNLHGEDKKYGRTGVRKDLEMFPGPYNVEGDKTLEYEFLEDVTAQDEEMVDEIKRSRPSEEEMDPPQQEILDELSILSHSADYAWGSLGQKSNLIDTQLTEFANGDIQTGFKPVTSVYRPYTLQDVRKNSEVKHSRVAGGMGIPASYSDLGETWTSKDSPREKRKPYLLTKSTSPSKTRAG